MSIEKELKNILKDDQVLADSESLKHYGQDWTRYYEPKPSAIAFPKTTEDIVALVNFARTTKIALVPSGGRTGLSSAAVATNNEIVVSFEKMNQILDFDSMDQVVRVQPGVITQTIQEFAVEKGLYFPVDFASKGSSQIGGNIATNAGGVKVLRYGLTRNWVGGLKVVTGKGEVLNLNKSLVKNASGYDLMQLFIGSEGTLGFIAEAEIKMCRPPYPLQVMLFAVPNLKCIMKIYEMAKKQLSLTAFEMFSEVALKYVLEHSRIARPLPEGSPYYVLVEGELIAESTTEDFVKLFEDGVNHGWIDDGIIAQTETQFKEIWSMRENVAESVAKFTPYKNDISVRLSRVPDFITEVDNLLKNDYPNFEIVWFGHIGDGNLHISILKPDDWKKEKFFEACRKVDEHLYATIQKFEGSISAEHGVGLAKKAFLHFTRSNQEVEYMRLIKKQFDPDNIMNPGKIF
ncbi:MAG: FAD-linked oxidase [Proteobacteria bacterium SG_bin7]|nr:MAG: FAD-linked oxidase [Proteobacteria bacterium SG_bin7]